MEKEFNLNVAKKDFIEAAIDDNKKTKRKKQEKKKKISAEEAVRQMFVSAKKARRAAKSDNVNTLGDEYAIRENAKFELTDKSYNYRFNFFKLKDSLDNGKLLTGSVSSIEKVGDFWTAIIYMGVFKVYIPIFDFMDIDLNASDDILDKDGLNAMSRRLNANINFVVNVIDEENEIAFANRNKAMKAKREIFYNKKFDGEYLINEGDIVKGNVVATSKNGITVEIGGVECFIASRDVNNRFVLDASDFFDVGEEADVKIISIYKDEKTGDIELEASIKEVDRQEYEIAKDSFVPGKKYIGKISVINQNGVFVAVDIGYHVVDVLCAIPDFGKTPIPGANVALYVTDKNEKGVFGIIQKISYR